MYIQKLTDSQNSSNPFKKSSLEQKKREVLIQLNSSNPYKQIKEPIKNFIRHHSRDSNQQNLQLELQQFKAPKSCSERNKSENIVYRSNQNKIEISDDKKSQISGQLSYERSIEKNNKKILQKLESKKKEIDEILQEKFEVKNVNGKQADATTFTQPSQHSYNQKYDKQNTYCFYDQKKSKIKLEKEQIKDQRSISLSFPKSDIQSLISPTNSKISDSNSLSHNEDFFHKPNYQNKKSRKSSLQNSSATDNSTQCSRPSGQSQLLGCGVVSVSGNGDSLAINTKNAYSQSISLHPIVSDEMEELKKLVAQEQESISAIVSKGIKALQPQSSNSMPKKMSATVTTFYKNQNLELQNPNKEGLLGSYEEYSSLSKHQIIEKLLVSEHIMKQLYQKTKMLQEEINKLKEKKVEDKPI